MKKESNRSIIKRIEKSIKNKDKLPYIKCKTDIISGDISLDPKKYLNKKNHKLTKCYNINEVATLLNVSLKFVEKLVKEKKIVPVVANCWFDKKKISIFVKKFRKDQSKALDKLAIETSKLI